MRLPSALLTLVIIITSGCYRSTDEVWDDTLTAGHHVGRGFDTLGGKGGDSRQVQSTDDFYALNEDPYNYSPDFMPYFEEGDPSDLYCMADVRPSKHSPGDPGSSIPGIEGFREPSSDAIYSKVFRPVYFEYNSNQVKGQENLQILQNIASYMQQHPSIYVFVEGHCDKRGPEAYNFALGSRRSNEVRNYLIGEGVSPDHLFTISYGKEKLLALGDDEASHRMNRRDAFKIYEK